MKGADRGRSSRWYSWPGTGRMMMILLLLSHPPWYKMIEEGVKTVYVMNPRKRGFVGKEGFLFCMSVCFDSN